MSRPLPAVFLVAFVLLLAAGALLPSRPEAQGKLAASSGAVQDGEEMTEAERREEAARRACKVSVCAALRNRRPGQDIACTLVKSWRKEQVAKIVSKAKVGWPWGDVRCSGDVALKRQTLIRAMSEPKFEVVVDRHTVACEVQREKGNTVIKVELSPKVTFENGKAVVATLNWGKVEGPGFIKGALWTATATDNALNVLEGTVIEKVNEFVATKCDEVKDEWKGK